MSHGKESIRGRFYDWQNQSQNRPLIDPDARRATRVSGPLLVLLLWNLPEVTFYCDRYIDHICLTVESGVVDRNHSGDALLLIVQG